MRRERMEGETLWWGVGLHLRVRRESTEAWDGAEPDGLCVHEDKPGGKVLKKSVTP